MDSSGSDDEMEVDENGDTVQHAQKSEINVLKILKDIRSICEDPVLAAATYRVYLDLCEVRRYDEVKYFFNSDIKQPYLEARKKKAKDPVEIFVPILSAKKYSFKDIEQYQNTFKSDTINIAICDSNTIAIYALTRS